MNVFKVMIAVVAIATPLSSRAAYDLIYDASDGSLTIDTKGGPISGYVFEFSPSQSVFTGPFIVVTDPPANIINLTVNANQQPMYGPGVSNRTGFEWYLSEVKLLLGVGIPDPRGVVELGQVMPPGLPEQVYVDTFSNTLSNFQYVAGEGQGATGAFNLVYVPEPTVIAPLAIGGLLFTRRRRNAASFRSVRD